MTGPTWKRREYFQLDHVELLADFHDGRGLDYRIGGYGLTTSAGIVAFWGDMWHGRRIISEVSNNQNAS